MMSLLKRLFRLDSQGGENDEIRLPWTAPAVFEGTAGMYSVDEEAMRFEPTGNGSGAWSIPLTEIRWFQIPGMAGADALKLEVETQSDRIWLEFVSADDRGMAWVVSYMMAKARLDPVRAELSNRMANLTQGQFEVLVTLIFSRGFQCSVRFVAWPGGRDIQLTTNYSADSSEPRRDHRMCVGVSHVRAGSTAGPGDVAAFRDRAAGTAPVLFMMTNGKFSNAAKKAASEPGQQLVEIFDAEAMTDDMIVRRLGVREGADGALDIDEQFWGEF